jgi:hypothetical protein
MQSRGIGFALAAIAFAGSASAQPVVWTAPSLSRIGAGDPAGSSRNITIYAAKGESESFQIAVRGPAAIVNVSASDFEKKGSAGRIAKSHVVLYREHYIRVDNTVSCPHTDRPCCNPSLGPGTYPEALIPLDVPQSGAGLQAVPFRVGKDRNQPLWIDVDVPRDAAAGTYTSTITISSEQGPDATIEAALVVWNFELPLQPALKTVFVTDHLTTPFQLELLKHRLMPKDVDPANLREFRDKFGLSIASLPFYSDANPKKGTIGNSPGVAAFEKEAAARKDSALPLYCYSADEISGAAALYEPLKKWGRDLHAAGVRNLVTMMPDPRLYDDGSGTGRSAVDIWVVLPFQYDQSVDRIRDVQRKGDEVWSYNTLVQDNYSPKWHIDFPPINFRIHPGFLNQSLGLTGLLYWRFDRWKADPWNDAYGDLYPGDGQLSYPGDQVGIRGGVVPSMRLKWLRDGVDDFDYIDLLKKAGCGEWALQISRGAGRNWSDWTRDPEVLEAARRRLGETLSDGAKDCR